MATLVIPARFASKRLPGKPLLAETGRPLVVHVLERAREASRIDVALVATDDRRILDAVRDADGDAVLTSEEHRCGTERVAEVARGRPGEELFVNLQGDEPEIDPADIDLLVRTLEESDADWATLAAPIRDDADLGNPDVVKVVVRDDGRALYFSRAPIPFSRDGDRAAAALRHIGIYGYRREALLRYADLPRSPLEETERLEQLRALQHGMEIRVARVENAPPGIDTMGAYRAFVRRQAARTG